MFISLTLVVKIHHRVALVFTLFTRLVELTPKFLPSGNALFLKIYIFGVLNFRRLSQKIIKFKKLCFLLQNVTYLQNPGKFNVFLYYKSDIVNGHLKNIERDSSNIHLIDSRWPNEYDRTMTTMIVNKWTWPKLKPTNLNVR